jgi:hypothetical protein
LRGLIVDQVIVPTGNRLGTDSAVRPAHDRKILAATAPPGHAVVAQRHAAREQERFAEPELVILG